MDFTIEQLIILVVIGFIVIVIIGIRIIKYLKPIFDLYFKTKENYFRVQELKLEVYDKRVNLYDELYKFIKHIVVQAKLDTEKLHEFDKVFLKAKFLLIQKHMLI